MMRNPKKAVGDTWRIYWSTQAEMEFLDDAGKGKWRKQEGARDPDLRFKCLMGYRDSIFKRSNWGDIDRQEIILYLNKLLEPYGVSPMLIYTIKSTEKGEENV